MKHFLLYYKSSVVSLQSTMMINNYRKGCCFLTSVGDDRSLGAYYFCDFSSLKFRIIISEVSAMITSFDLVRGENIKISLGSCAHINSYY